MGEETRPQVFNGTFGFAYIEMSFKVECSVSHYFPNCDTSCELEGNCTCLSGYTGPLCEVNINDCIGVNCSGNGECIDGVNAFNCNCFHGYSGNMCKVNIDDCIGVNCSGNGNCSDKVGSFTCDCDIGYSGALCQDEQPSKCHLHIVNQFHNPLSCRPNSQPAGHRTRGGGRSCAGPGRCVSGT